jgi:DNA topoisomerase-1
LGDYQEHDVAASVGRYGPYIRHGSKFYSLPQEDDPYTVTYDRAIEIIEEKKKEEAKKNINTFEYDGKELRVLNGPYGPYISYNKQNYKIPKDYEAHKLTLDDCIKILEDPKNQSKKKRKGGGNKKTSKKSS